MSIWSSWRTIGHDRTFPEDSCGDVRSYASGWSNHYPDPANSGGKHVTGRESATVVMDEEAARALRDDLDSWLDIPKAHPLAEPAPTKGATT